jgi:hypothetical protein
MTWRWILVVLLLIILVSAGLIAYARWNVDWDCLGNCIHPCPSTAHPTGVMYIDKDGCTCVIPANWEYCE